MEDNEKEIMSTDLFCEYCRNELWFDGNGCFCINPNCIVFNKYVLEQVKVDSKKRKELEKGYYGME